MFLAVFTVVVAGLCVLEWRTRPKDDRPTWHKRNTR